LTAMMTLPSFAMPFSQCEYTLHVTVGTAGTGSVVPVSDGSPAECAARQQRGSDDG
jgi:hypothetical protein